MMPHGKGNSHLNQLNNRYKHSDDVPLTLEKLSEYTGYALTDLHKIAKVPFVLLNCVSSDHVAEFTDKIQVKGASISMPTPSEQKEQGFAINGFSTKNKTLLKGLMPSKPPKLVRSSVERDALLAAYAWANRLDRYRAKEIKTLPAPKKISLRYVKKL